MTDVKKTYNEDCSGT